MATCELCGNDYAGDHIFCCAHCARESGASGVADRA